jgi:branched-chain amino acid transport system ATP-binding protein
MSVVIVEQDVAVAQRVSDRVYCFQEGRVSLEGASDALTREQISQAYFGLVAPAVEPTPA